MAKQRSDRDRYVGRGSMDAQGNVHCICGSTIETRACEMQWTCALCGALHWIRDENDRHAIAKGEHDA